MIGVNEGKGKGVLGYWKNNCSIVDTVVSGYDTNRHTTDPFQVVKVTTHDNVSILSVYRQSGTSFDKLVCRLKKLIYTDKCIVMGDFNFPADEANSFTEFMNAAGFQQIVTEPTHDGGNIIDHVYIRNVSCKIFQHYVYFSDHSALCLMID